MTENHPKCKHKPTGTNPAKIAGFVLSQHPTRPARQIPLQI